MFEKEDLITLATMPMPFGKYKGRALIDLPEAYLLWFARSGFPENRLGGLLQLALEIKINGLESLLQPLKTKPRNSHLKENTVSIDNFLAQLSSAPGTVEFQQVVDLIGQHYVYTATRFTNGIGGEQIVNAAGTNEGSCRIFAFAQIHKLSDALTLQCFGKYYREDVLQHPEGSDHANIRTFMRCGWPGIKFDQPALLKKI